MWILIVSSKTYPFLLAGRARKGPAPVSNFGLSFTYISTHPSCSSTSKFLNTNSATGMLSSLSVNYYVEACGRYSILQAQIEELLCLLIFVTRFILDLC